MKTISLVLSTAAFVALIPLMRAGNITAIVVELMLFANWCITLYEVCKAEGIKL